MNAQTEIRVRRRKVTPDQQRLILAALNRYLMELGMDRDTFATMKNRAYEVRDTRLRIERVELLVDAIENAGGMELVIEK